MKKFFRGKQNQKKLIVLFSVFIVAAAILAFAMLSSAGLNPSEYLLAKVGGNYGAGYGATFGTGGKSNNPVLASVPSSVTAGKMITLKGTGFTPKNNRVHIGKKQVNNISSYENGTSLVFEIPAKKDLPNGTYPLFVRNSKGTSNTVSIEITGVAANSFTPNVNTPAKDNRLTVDLKVASGEDTVSDGPITVPKRARVTLSWGPTNGAKCVASNGWSGTRSLKGSQSTAYPTVSKTYTLTCSGKGGSASDSVTVNVVEPVSALGTGPSIPEANKNPIAYSNWSVSGVNKGSKLVVTKGVPVVGVSLIADTSSDPNGWTKSGVGVSQGGKCEWNADLEEGDSPAYEKTISNPASPAGCNVDLGTLTFNQNPGEYRFRILRITDAAGAVSNDGLVWVLVQ